MFRPIILRSRSTAPLSRHGRCSSWSTGCARAGVTTIAPWRDLVQAVGIPQAGRIVRDSGIAVSCLCRSGLFPAADEAGRRAALDDNKRAVDEAAGIGAQCLVLIGGGLPKGSKDLAGAHAQVRDGLAALLPYAHDAGVPLALEPLHPMYAADRACVNTLAHATDLCDQLGNGLGIALDAYHVWWDPGPAAADRARGQAHHHLARLRLAGADDRPASRPRHDGRRRYRPAPLRQMVEATGYAGAVDVEIFSANNWWKRDPDEVLKVCIERFRACV
ncbi:MAG: sugar phosphate isomerase/epimerase family protein [Chitinophagaceae bacterium]